MLQAANPTHALGARWTPAALNQTLAGKITLIVAGSLFVALCAHASVRLPFTPVPLTLGDLAVVLVGMALGPVAGFTAMIAYLAEGAAGAPVFNPGGGGGLIQLLGPTGGYLFAYPLAALIAGAAVRTRTLPKLRAAGFVAAAIGALLASTAIITSGVCWLAVLLHLSAGSAIKLGAVPFLPGQLVKIAAAAGIYASVQRWIQTSAR